MIWSKYRKTLRNIAVKARLFPEALASHCNHKMRGYGRASADISQT